MLRTRIIPCLLLDGESLVKTVKFSKPAYIGDPCNTCRIFNELEVDELAFFDISASKNKQEPNYQLLAEIADECFMPLSYGGGITSLETAEKIFKIGFEKVVLNTSVLTNPKLIGQIASVFGSQSIIVSIDVKKNIFGKYSVYGCSGTLKYEHTPEVWAKTIEDQGAGEILLTSIDREGTWTGLDIELIRRVTKTVNIPVIAHGGAGQYEHIKDAITQGKASAVALGSLMVFQAKGLGVLINYPYRNQIEAEISHLFQ